MYLKRLSVLLCQYLTTVALLTALSLVSTNAATCAKDLQNRSSSK